jgi:hypothetical protein
VLLTNGTCWDSCVEPRTFKVPGESRCQQCHGTCKTCNGTGRGACLTCADDNFVVVEGVCGAK